MRHPLPLTPPLGSSSSLAYHKAGASRSSLPWKPHHTSRKVSLTLRSDPWSLVPALPSLVRQLLCPAPSPSWARVPFGLRPGLRLPPRGSLQGPSRALHGSCLDLQEGTGVGQGALTEL